MSDCSTRAFDGCSCSGQCQSATVPIINLTGRIDRRSRERRVMVDKLIAGQLAVAALGALTLSFIFVAVPVSQKVAKQEQEITVSWKR